MNEALKIQALDDNKHVELREEEEIREANRNMFDVLHNREKYPDMKKEHRLPW